MSARTEYLKMKKGTTDFKTVVLKADGKFQELEPEAEVKIVHPEDEVETPKPKKKSRWSRKSTED